MAASDATFYSYLNTGVGSIPQSQNATFEAMENVGFVLPPQVEVHTSQMAWGTAMTPRKYVTLISDSANAVAYNYEGDVTG